MANIREYTSPVSKLSPDEKAYQAWEMAGRRIGPLFSQQASEVKEGGRINAQVISGAGKGQEALAKQAEQINTDALDYMGVLKQQRASGGGGGISHGGGRQPRSIADPREYATAASNLASAANRTISQKEKDDELADFRARQFPQVGDPDETTSGGGPSGSTTSDITHEDIGETGGWYKGDNNEPSLAWQTTREGDSPYYNQSSFDELLNNTITGGKPQAATAAPSSGVGAFFSGGYDTLVGAASSVYNWSTNNASQTQAAEAGEP